MRLGLIRPRFPCTLIVNSNIKPGPPFSSVPGNVVSTRTSPPGPPEGLFGSPDIIPPPLNLFIKLVLRITSPPLNRFPRFQLRWIPFESTFLTTYYTSGYVQVIPRQSSQTQQSAISVSCLPDKH